MKNLMDRKKALLAALAILLLAVIAWVALDRGKQSPRSEETAEIIKRDTGARTFDGSNEGPGDGGGIAAVGTLSFEGKSHEEKVAMLGKAIAEVLARFRKGGIDPEKAITLLGDLERALSDAGASAAGAAIVAFLDSGEDAATGLEFIVGEGGVLEEAPTMRTAMLDKLGRMSAEDAVAYAAKIFSEARSADEWAVNLRNLSWGNSEGRFTAELGTRLEEMLDRSDWIQEPSAGFVEAFDIAVSLGGQEQIANMASVLNLGSDNGLDFAAFLSLDRIALREPDAVFDFFKKDPSLMSWSPDVRASLMARAVDPASDLQREALESYMLEPGTGAEEFKHFSDLYPLRSYSVGPRLATKDETFAGLSETARADIETLKLVRGWLEDPRFAGRHEDLKRVEGRLVEFEQQIERARQQGSLK